MSAIRIVLVDDHTVLRSGLRALLERQGDMAVVGEAGSGEEGMVVIEREQPDIVLMDLSLPDSGGIEVTQHLTENGSTTRIIALTMHEDQRHVRQVLEAGAAGYVSKRAADSELVDAIRAVHRGEVFVHPSVARGVVQGFLGKEETREAPVKDPLSERELEVLTLLALGHTNQETADKLFISVKTVETHKARIVNKLSLRTRADLVRYALDRGLLQDL